MRSFFRGFRAFFDGFRLLGQGRLWTYALLPGILSLASLAAAWYATDSLLSLAQRALPSHWLLEDASLWQSAVVLLLRIIGWGLFLITALFAFPVLMRLLCLPFLGALSEATENFLQGGVVAPPPSGFWNSAWQSLRMGAVLSLQELAFVAVLGFIPWLGILAAFLAGCYYTGAGFYDLVLERRCATLAERRVELRALRMEIAGLGLAVRLASLAPIVGALLAPLAATAAAASLLSASRPEMRLARPARLTPQR